MITEFNPIFLEIWVTQGSRGWMNSVCPSSRCRWGFLRSDSLAGWTPLISLSLAQSTFRGEIVWKINNCRVCRAVDRWTKGRIKWKIKCLHWFLHQNHQVQSWLVSLPRLNTIKSHPGRAPETESGEFSQLSPPEGKPLFFSLHFYHFCVSAVQENILILNGNVWFEHFFSNTFFAADVITMMMKLLNICILYLLFFTKKKLIWVKDKVNFG